MGMPNINFRAIKPRLESAYNNNPKNNLFKDIYGVTRWINKNKLENYVLKRSIRNHIDPERGFRFDMNTLVYAHKDFFKRYITQGAVALNENHEYAPIKHIDYTEPNTYKRKPKFEKLIVMDFNPQFKSNVIKKNGSIEGWDQIEYDMHIKAKENRKMKENLPVGATYMQGIMNKMENVMLQNQQKDIQYTSLLEQFEDLNKKYTDLNEKIERMSKKRQK